MNPNLISKLKLVISKGNLEEVKAFVDHHQLKKIPVGLDCFLEEAVRGAHLEVVQYLIEKCGANVHAHDEAALNLASEQGYLAIVQYLITKGGVDMDESDALELASKNGHLNIVIYLLDNGAAPNVMHDPVVLASEYGHLDIVQYIIEHGGLRGSDLDTSLKMAVEYGHTEIIVYLMAHGAKVQTKYINSLFSAARNGNLEILQILIENGCADVHLSHEYALRIACEMGHLQCVQYLFETGKANLNDFHAGDSQSSALNDASRNGHFDIVKYLINKGAYDVTAYAYLYDQDFALRSSACKGNLEILKYLLENLEYEHEYIEMAFEISASHGQLLVLKFFIDEYGVDIHLNDDTAFRSAAVGGHLHIVQYLVEEKGVDIHSKENDALCRASTHGHLNVVKFLIEKGADPYAGLVPPFQSAIMNNQFEVLQYLVQTCPKPMYPSSIQQQNHLIIRSDSSDLRIVKLLIDQGATIGGLDANKLLEHAISLDNSRTFKLNYNYTDYLFMYYHGKLQLPSGEFKYCPGSERYAIHKSIDLSRYFAWKVQKFKEVSQEVKKALMVIHASQGKIVRALLDTIVLYKIGVLWLGRWKQYIKNHDENFIERYEAILNGNRLVEYKAFITGMEKPLKKKQRHVL